MEFGITAEEGTPEYYAQWMYSVLASKKIEGKLFNNSCHTLPDVYVDFINYIDECCHGEKVTIDEIRKYLPDQYLKKFNKAVEKFDIRTFRVLKVLFSMGQPYRSELDLFLGINAASFVREVIQDLQFKHNEKAKQGLGLREDRTWE